MEELAGHVSKNVTTASEILQAQSSGGNRSCPLRRSDRTRCGLVVDPLTYMSKIYDIVDMI